MNIFEFARGKEQQAEETYRRLAGMALSVGMKDIFTRLADAEKHHFEIILKMEAAQSVVLAGSDLLLHVQTATRNMKVGVERFLKVTEQIDVYTLAQAQEADMEMFYLEHAEKTTDEYQRDILLALAREEHQHSVILENLVEFICYPANHPEDAEFHARDERDLH